MSPTKTLAKKPSAAPRFGLKETMEQLRKLGTAQNVKIYKRHGAGDDQFGVSFANLNLLKKKIKADHELAVQLWETGNADARNLATMIAEPARVTEELAERWVRDTGYYLQTDFLLPGLFGRSPIAPKLARKWMDSKEERTKACAYGIFGMFLKEGREFSDVECRAILARIEKEIHGSPNRARYAMNGAVIGIGIYRHDLTPEALAAARRIGKVEVDHGETGCKTPDAESYILKATSRSAKRKK